MYTKATFKQQLKKQITEESSSGAVGAYNSKYAFSKPRNYYITMGYKLVDAAKLRKQQKGTVYTNLWK